MACLKEDGMHPELRHRFIRMKIKDPTQLKTLLNKQDGMLSDGQLAGCRCSTISVSAESETGSNW